RRRPTHRNAGGATAPPSETRSENSPVDTLLCCHFLSLLVRALIERHLRTAMADASLDQLSKVAAA
ncbi:MAG: hypothetical protein WEC79_02440, partial [Thermomicrobiales bacterium]